MLNHDPRCLARRGTKRDDEGRGDEVRGNDPLAIHPAWDVRTFVVALLSNDDRRIVPGGLSF